VSLLRQIIISVVILYVSLVVNWSNQSYPGAERRYGYTWEHSLDEWAQITREVREHPRQCQVYNWVNVPGPKWHEEKEWVWLPCK
jgi:hypothetical protein